MPSTCAKSTLDDISNCTSKRFAKRQGNRSDNAHLGATYCWQPETKHLCSKLLSIGGQEVELTSLPDRDLPILLALGERFTGTPVRLVRQGNSSFRNVAHLWLEQKDPLFAIGMGYALASDRIWYPHAWGIENTGIVETTTIYVDYFGRLLTRNEAIAFARMHAITPVSL